MVQFEDDTSQRPRRPLAKGETGLQPRRVVRLAVSLVGSRSEALIGALALLFTAGVGGLYCQRCDPRRVKR